MLRHWTWIIVTIRSSTQTSLITVTTWLNDFLCIIFDVPSYKPNLYTVPSSSVFKARTWNYSNWKMGKSHLPLIGSTPNSCITSKPISKFLFIQKLNYRPEHVYRGSCHSSTRFRSIDQCVGTGGGSFCFSRVFIISSSEGSRHPV